MKIYNDFLFYVIYQFWEKAPSKWWSEWKTTLTISFLIVFLLSALSNYLYYFLLWDLTPSSLFEVLALAFLIFGFNYYQFLHKKKWKKILSKNENISKTDFSLRILIVGICILAIVSGLFYSYHLLSVMWKL